MSTDAMNYREEIEAQESRWKRSYDQGLRHGHDRGYREGYERGKEEAEKPARVLKQWLSAVGNGLFWAVIIYLAIATFVDLGKEKARNSIDEMLKGQGTSLEQLERNAKPKG